MIPAERRQKILEFVNQHGMVEIAKLSELFQVSEMTIHRDLTYLEKTGRVKKTYGGAVSNLSKIETAFELRRRANVEEKQAIGRAAANLIEDGESILVDASTTCMAMVAELDRNKSLTVFCTGVTSLSMLMEMENVQVYCTGGLVSRPGMSFLGPSSIDFLRKIHVDKCFLGASGIHPVYGITDPLWPEVEIKQYSAEAANEVIILADHTKFGQLARFNVFPLNKVDLIITNRVENSAIQQDVEAAGVRMLYA